MQKMTRTFVRTKETMDKYDEITKKRQENGGKADCFTDWERNLIKEFKYWVIIENEFPYDAIATTSHMISTKREVRLDWNLLNDDEIKEFEDIKENYLHDNYDVLWENLPKGQSIPGHFHLHLLVLKREEI